MKEGLEKYGDYDFLKKNVDYLEDAMLARDMPGMADIDSSLLLFCKNVKKIVDEKFNKYIEITHMYQEQIKEIKTQLVEIEKDSPQYTELENVIESLKEEQRNELDEIEDEYNEKIQTFQRNFKTNEFKTNPALLLLEEQFRLSMCNKINDLILPD